MKDETKKIIKKLIRKEITDKKFIKVFCLVEKNFDYALEELLENSVKEKNAEDLVLLMFLIYKFEKKSINIINMLCDIFEDNWHYEHENIAFLFEEARPIKAVNSLYRVAISKFPYLDFDYNYALAVKCIWALGNIRNEESVGKLKLLATSNNEIIKNNALEQLERIKLNVK